MGQNYPPKTIIVLIYSYYNMKNYSNLALLILSIGCIVTSIFGLFTILSDVDRVFITYILIINVALFVGIVEKIVKDKRK